MSTAVVDRPREVGYKAALSAYAAARRLQALATIFIILVCIVALGAATGAVIVLIVADSSDTRWYAAGALFGCVFWTVGGLLLGTAAQTFARDVQTRAPWEQR